MSEIRVGDRVFLECEVREKDIDDNTYTLRYKNWYGDKYSKTDYVKDNVLHTTDEIYNKGLNDAWNLTKKIVLLARDGGYSWQELKDIFGYTDRESVFETYTPQEALAKVKAYEEECNKIKVGDVVTTNGSELEGIVTKVVGHVVYRLFRDGSCGDFYKEDLVKIGHFDSIDEFMRVADD